ncbi:hypothetical protein COW36_05530 [bacterium (Candidatus Blackallbacteria) CG17_big_fil_post_rev_8_21_14_2_50_48_46]|uniref:Transporter n=1 Tax=bacterium (Candidatus Blackallbacteria) CG17_big_fil_post_rev_8_21_14_2_50_48_46 TaxID=2014261 RepID=A0A2M7G814_9BACT|nr:MAG: hypothetical protein COW64_21125 [bacterium (Candidatus Blackallbacteria) CG18_big_fil_WC_8_21_14_2_50_49_26]PIW18229.1 MAG: hypothetical protein COW36_05530 [bacterium (Candidatus Blackallbacteria) CG17_big_fil_post_rev_8_21_14_2_50_48_46]PIW50660.1 MAG: hypothetical protein COW20_01795 [bacterium (Candidatus Blackallbacteria) CG13_big_fil_rev_8_21_14_2_50_49_14]
MLSSLEQVLLFLSFFCLSVGIGASIEKKDILAVWQDKKAILAGLGLQYLLLPSLACVWILTLNLPPLAAGTLLLIATCPGGTTSNMFTYFAKADVSLSIFLTSLTTCLAFFMTPLLLALFGGSLGISGSLQLPLPNLIVTLFAALLPAGIGYLIRAKSEGWAKRTERVGAWIGYVSIGIMLVIWGPKILELLQKEDLRVFVATGLLSLSGIFFAHLLSRGLHFEQRIARTLSFETGIQNAPLAFAIISLNLPRETVLQISWIPLLYGALSVGNAALFTLLYRFSALRIAPELQTVRQGE